MTKEYKPPRELTVKNIKQEPIKVKTTTTNTNKEMIKSRVTLPLIWKGRLQILEISLDRFLDIVKCSKLYIKLERSKIMNQTIIIPYLHK